MHQVTISFVMSVCLSVGRSIYTSARLSYRPSVRMKQPGYHWMDVYEIWYLNIFGKSVGKISFIRIRKKRVFYVKPNIQLWLYLARFFLEWQHFQTILGKSKHILFSIKFYENLSVYEIVWKNIVESGRPQMTIRRMRLACWIPRVANTLRICNN